MPHFEIKTAEPLHASWIIEAQKQMALESEGLVLDEQILSKGVQAVFERPQRGTYYLAFDQDQICGMMLVQSEWSEWRNGEVLWIHSVFVPQAYRKQGVYRSLYAFLHQKVTQSDAYKGIRLLVDKRNAAAIAVYERLGMNNEHYHTYEWLK